ncbi:MAG: hypothetical protein A2390_00665 [Candidatus Liptonbacteria bacterium RIFOXYB1_FULL_36_10]|nr:MAG: hypothetical protein A2390_00665 [Candidatus Liptonbacteria bacterium RIFOXYB1_FULL_36_10]
MLTAEEKNKISCGAGNGEMFRLEIVRVESETIVNEPIFFCCDVIDLEWFLGEFEFCIPKSYFQEKGYDPYDYTQRGIMEQLSKAVQSDKIGIRIGRRGEIVFDRKDKIKLASFISVSVIKKNRN